VNFFFFLRREIYYDEILVRITGLNLDLNSEVSFGRATGIHENKAVQYKIWAPAGHMFWDCGKLQKTLIDLVSRRYFWLHTDC